MILYNHQIVYPPPDFFVNSQNAQNFYNFNHTIIYYLKIFKLSITITGTVSVID